MRELLLSDYSIYIGDFAAKLQHWLQERAHTQHIVLTDEHTARHCLPTLRAMIPDVKLSYIEIPSGEQHKNIQTCANIWDALLALRADRRALLMCLGGGVVGDMGGFCAATYKRGIDFIQIPTTLLSQVDSSIGGKLGIDFGEVKNSIGVFQNPKAVFISPVFLDTLPTRDLKSGLAEMLKHALIADAPQWKALSNVNWTNIDRYVSDSLEIKQTIVEADPFERGIRKALNFGHTIGHAVESLSLATDAPLLHGEAIAVGMIAEAYLSHHVTALPMSSVSEIAQTILQTFPHYDISDFSTEKLLTLMQQDKKNENDNINFSLLSSIGKVHINQTASQEQIVAALKYYQTLKHLK